MAEDVVTVMLSLEPHVMMLLGILDPLKRKQNSPNTLNICIPSHVPGAPVQLWAP